MGKSNKSPKSNRSYYNVYIDCTVAISLMIIIQDEKTTNQIPRYVDNVLV